jgi:hypothetical protein
MRALLALVLAIAIAPLVHADTPASPAKATAPAVTKPPPAPPEKAVAKMSRAELEAEVTALRADNKKIRADFEAQLTKERERAKRLQKEIGQPAAELK